MAADEISILQAAEMARERCDSRLQQAIAGVTGAGREIRCRAGCDACCRQLIVVSPLEARPIAAFVAQRPELAARAAARIDGWKDRLGGDPDLAERFREFDAAEGYLPSREGGALEAAYWRAQIPCPFLEEGRCAIYPVRPFSCREHYVVTDPALCAVDPNLATTAGVRMEYRAIASWVGSACFGQEDRLIPLPLALDYAARAEAEEPAEEQTVRASLTEAERRTRLALAALGIRGGAT